MKHSEDYPLGGSAEQYDIEREKQIEIGNEIILKGGAVVRLKNERATACKGCGAKIWFAYTMKNNKLIPIEETRDGEYQAHFASCPAAGNFRRSGRNTIANQIREEENNQEILNSL